MTSDRRSTTATRMASRSEPRVAAQVAARPFDWPHDGGVVAAATAFVVIDMQRDFCLDSGYFARSGGDTAATSAIVPTIASLLAAARQAGLVVVHTREGHLPDRGDAPPMKLWRSARAGAEIGAKGPLGRLLIRGEFGWDIVDALAPKGGELVIDKAGYSAFHGTELETVLSARGVEKLILCGVTTDVCVHSTLRDATDRGYECLTVEDACAAGDPALHDACLRIIHGEGGIFGATATAQAVIDALSAIGARKT